MRLGAGATGAQYANLTLFKTYLHIKYSPGFTNSQIM